MKLLMAFLASMGSKKLLVTLTSVMALDWLLYRCIDRLAQQSSLGDGAVLGSVALTLILTRGVITVGYLGGQSWIDRYTGAMGSLLGKKDAPKEG